MREEPPKARPATDAKPDVDFQIIALLKEDGRATNKWIAQRLGISEPTVAQRIRRLTEGGQLRVIAQQVVSRTSPNSLIAIIEVFLDRFDVLDEAAKALADIPDVLTIYSTLGRPELVAHLWSQSRVLLTETIRRISQEIPGLARMNVLPVLDLALFRSEYGDLSASHGALWARNGGKRDEMLQLLSENARQPIRSLAAQLGIPESTARAHLGAIEKDPSIRFGAVLDAAHFGRTVWADVRLSINPRRLGEAMAQLELREDLSFVAHIAGQENLALFCIDESTAGLNRFVDEVVRQLPGVEEFRVLRVPAVLSHNHHYSL